MSGPTTTAPRSRQALSPLQGSHISRRCFLAATAAVITIPQAAGAQPTAKTWRIGFLQPSDRPETLLELRSGLRDLGYTEGQNIVLESRVVQDANHDALIAELLRLKIDVLVTWTTPLALASKRAAPALPIVAITGDPVGTRLVESLARPGGNVTGIAILDDMLGVKNLELLKELVPSATRVAVVWNPDNALWPRVLVALDDAAKTLGVTIQRLEVRRAEDLHGAFSRAVADRANALLFVNDALFTANRAEISAHALKNRLPAIYGQRAIVAAGGLISYAADFNAMMRRTAIYVDKILKREKPADLPVEQPTKFELVINLKTAKTIGLTVPPFLLTRADEVIE
jgi:putative tryptophan/tyrosine transport system substrate-binding protein